MNTTQQLEKEILEKKIELYQILNEMDGESVVKFLVKAYQTKKENPENFYGLLNDRDHLVDVALVRIGLITQDEADQRYKIRGGFND